MANKSQNTQSVFGMNNIEIVATYADDLKGFIQMLLNTSDSLLNIPQLNCVKAIRENRLTDANTFGNEAYGWIDSNAKRSIARKEGRVSNSGKIAKKAHVVDEETKASSEYIKALAAIEAAKSVLSGIVDKGAKLQGKKEKVKEMIQDPEMMALFAEMTKQAKTRNKRN